MEVSPMTMVGLDGKFTSRETRKRWKLHSSSDHSHVTNEMASKNKNETMTAHIRNSEALHKYI